MVKPSDIDLPVTFKKQLLFKSGNMNRIRLPPEEVNLAPKNTKWDKFNSSLLYSHKDTNRVTKEPTEDWAEAWQGNVYNVSSDGKGNVFGDIDVFKLDTAIALEYGKAPFAISAGIKYKDGPNGEARDISFRNFSLVSNPAVMDKDIFINFSLEDNSTDDGFKYANFSAVMSSDSSSGSPSEANSNNKMQRDDDEDEDEKKKKTNLSKDEKHEEKEKEQLDKESKEHPELPKETVKKIVEDHEKIGEFKEEKKANLEAFGYGVNSQGTQGTTTQISKELLPNEEGVNHNTLQQMAKDVIAKKSQSMANMANDEEAVMGDKGKMDGEKSEFKNTIENYTNTNERRLQDSTIMTEKKVPSVDERLMAIEDKISQFAKNMADKKANFEAEVALAAQAPVTPAPIAAPAPAPVVAPVETVKNASPVVDTDKLVGDIVSKVTERLAPSMKPAPMTTKEFGGQGQSIDATEDAVTRLANRLVGK